MRNHHKDCAIKTSHDSHLGACYDKLGNQLPDEMEVPDKMEPVTDELLTKIGDRAANIASIARGDLPWGYSESGMPVGAIGHLLANRPAEFFVDGDGMPGNPETERWFKAIALLRPLITNPPLEAVAISGETDDEWRPEGPRIEVRYRDETGLDIELAATITEEIKPYYDADMVLQQLTAKLGALAGDVNYAKNVHLRDRDGE